MPERQSQTNPPQTFCRLTEMPDRLLSALTGKVRFNQCRELLHAPGPHAESLVEDGDICLIYGWSSTIREQRLQPLLPCSTLVVKKLKPFSATIGKVIDVECIQRSTVEMKANRAHAIFGHTRFVNMVWIRDEGRNTPFAEEY